TMNYNMSLPDALPISLFIHETVRQHLTKPMKLGNNILAFVLFIFIGIPIFILFLPIMIVLYPIHFFQRKRFEKKYSEFLTSNNRSEEHTSELQSRENL